MGRRLPIPDALCPIPYAQFPMPDAQFPIPHARCPMPPQILCLLPLSGILVVYIFILFR